MCLITKAMLIIVLLIRKCRSVMQAYWKWLELVQLVIKCVNILGNMSACVCMHKHTHQFWLANNWFVYVYYSSSQNLDDPIILIIYISYVHTHVHMWLDLTKAGFHTQWQGWLFTTTQFLHQWTNNSCVHHCHCFPGLLYLGFVSRACWVLG